jgi:hypothetical protein
VKDTVAVPLDITVHAREVVTTDLFAREGRARALGEVRDLTGRILQKTGRVQRIAFGEQIAQGCRDQRLRRCELRQPALAFVGLEIERLTQMTAELAPQRWIERRQAHTAEVQACARGVCPRLFAALRVGIQPRIAIAERSIGTRRKDGVNGQPNAIDAARKQLVGRVCSVRLLTPGTTTMLDAEECFHLALHAGAMGDHHSCMTYLGEVLQRQPRNARAIYLLAVQYAELGLLHRAVAGIKTALMIEPDLELARFQLGLLLLFDNNEPVEAKGCLDHLRTSQNLALCAYSEAMIAVCDNEPTLAREKLAVGLSASSPDSPLAMLMRQVFERLLSSPDDREPIDNNELNSPRSFAACPPSLS